MSEEPTLWNKFIKTTKFTRKLGSMEKKRHDYLDTERFDHSGSQEHLLNVLIIPKNKEISCKF